MNTEPKSWRVWIKGKASDVMTAGEVWAMLQEHQINRDTLVQRDGDQRGWTALTDYEEDLRWFAASRLQQAKPASGAQRAAEIEADFTIGIGILLLLIAFVLGIFSLSMDITVEVESTGRSVNNIGLMNDRLVRVIVAGFLGLIGVLVLLMRKK